MQTTSSETQSSQPWGAGFLSAISGPIGGYSGVFPFLGLLIGIGSIVIGSMASQTNNDESLYFIIGGVVVVIAGIVGLLYTSGKGKPIADWMGNISGKGDESRSAGALALIVILITFGVFTTFFYSYSPTEALSFTTVVSLVGLVLGVIILLYKFAEKDALANASSRFAFSLYFFMPYALFTFGFVHDILMKKLLYIPASFAGLLGMLFNYMLSVLHATSTGTPIPPVTNSLCEIPGMAQLSSTFAPQSMMFTLSILAYIATYTSRSNIGGVSGFVLGSEYRWASWALFFSVYLFHLFVLYGSSCIDKSKAVWGLVLPLGWGGILGFLGFASLERYDRNNPPAPPPGGNNARSSGQGQSIDTATCSANASDGEFTCETFKDGKLETSVITE